MEKKVEYNDIYELNNINTNTNTNADKNFKRNKQSEINHDYKNIAYANSIYSPNPKMKYNKNIYKNNNNYYNKNQIISNKIKLYQIINL